MNHLAYDINHNLNRPGMMAEGYCDTWMDEMDSTMRALKRIDFRMKKTEKNSRRKNESDDWKEPDRTFEGTDRIGQNLLEIRENIYRIKELASVL